MPYTKLQHLVAGAILGIATVTPFILLAYLLNSVLPVWGQYIVTFVLASTSMFLVGVVSDIAEHVIQEHNSKYQ